jgi:Tfp pilus assembly protein PilF
LLGYKRLLKVSTTVQDGRLAVIDQRSLDRGALRGAYSDAEQLRERLAREKRWPESSRVLMLMADIEALLGDRSAASRVLSKARPEELATTEQKVVLASSAADRALDFKLAIKMLEGAEETVTVKRVAIGG